MKEAFRDPAIGEALATGDEQRATELERGAPLFIFLKRDHGALLQAAKQPRKALQYDIGNPHTASKMTRHRLPAGLYAPLRVFLYENEKGGSTFEYDKPSSLFGQFEDEQVSEIARGLDAALERALQRAVAWERNGDRSGCEKALVAFPASSQLMLGFGPKRRKRFALQESAFGTKRTCQSHSAMSAFGGKADIARMRLNVCF